MKNTRTQFKNGFTLVEIMVVVAIIALLAAIAIPNLLRARLNANETAAQAALKSIGTALEMYINTNNVYPPDTTSLIGITPPYLRTDYFDGATHNGYTFNADLTDSSYTVDAVPASSSQGTSSFTLSTGALIQKN
jgi:type IV pilus assembly protein PilA